MKPTITKTLLGWRLTVYRPHVNDGLKAENNFYMFWDGAVFELERIGERLAREQKAWAKLQYVYYSYLSVKEGEFIDKLWLRACRNITKRQYGYLTGILERQQKERI